MGARFKSAFTLIELLLAITVITVMSSFAIVQYSTARRSARDAHRKEDVRGYVSAIQKYKVAKGSAFITVPGSSAGLGADSQSYGRLNLKGETDGGARYTGGVTLAEELKNDGFINSISTDPLARNDNTPKDRDYVLTRCLANGNPAGGAPENFFAVWTKLEGGASQVETSNTVKFCGGTGSGGTGVTFASEVMPAPAASPNDEATLKYFAVGNDPVVATAAGVVGGGGNPPGVNPISVNLAPSKVSDIGSLAPTLTATVADGTGPYSYFFKCDVTSPTSPAQSTGVYSGCTYTNNGPNTVYPHPSVQVRDSLGATNFATVGLTIFPQLAVTLSAAPQSQTAPFDSTLTAVVTGGDVNSGYDYSFFCSNAAGTVPQNFPALNAAVKAVTCNYPVGSPQNPVAKVIVTQGGKMAQDTQVLTVTTAVTQLTASLLAKPAEGVGSVTTTLIARSSGGSGPTTYEFKCNPTDAYAVSTFPTPTVSSCAYTNSGTTTLTKTAWVKVTQPGGSVEAHTDITVYPAVQVTLSAAPSSGNGSLTSILTATVRGGKPGETINYTFYCNRSDAGVNITSPWSRKVDGVTTTTETASCAYTNTGSQVVTNTAKVIVEKGAGSYQAQTPVTIDPNGSSQPITVSLTANPTAGIPQYNKATRTFQFTPTITATLSGGAAGSTSNYTFYCDRADTATNITSPNSGKFDGVTAIKESVPCTYDNTGNTIIIKKAKVIVEHGATAIQQQVDIQVYPEIEIRAGSVSHTPTYKSGDVVHVDFVDSSGNRAPFQHTPKAVVLGRNWTIQDEELAVATNLTKEGFDISGNALGGCDQVDSVYPASCKEYYIAVTGEVKDLFQAGTYVRGSKSIPFPAGSFTTAPETVVVSKSVSYDAGTDVGRVQSITATGFEYMMVAGVSGGGELMPNDGSLVYWIAMKNDPVIGKYLKGGHMDQDGSYVPGPPSTNPLLVTFPAFSATPDGVAVSRNYFRVDDQMGKEYSLTPGAFKYEGDGANSTGGKDTNNESSDRIYWLAARNMP